MAEEDTKTQTDAKNLADSSGQTEAQKASAAEADAAAARTRAASAEASTRFAREQPAGHEAPQPSVNNPATKEGRLAQHEAIDRENDERNARNEEVFRKQLEDEQRMREEAAQRPEAQVPPTGKQRDENTPDLLPDGTQVWRA